MKRNYWLDHSPISFIFRQTPRDFVVEEIPLYEFSGEGEHNVYHMRKKNLSTWEMVQIIAKYLGIHQKEIGYAGLKDKNALTKQYISINKLHEEKMNSFSHDGLKILSRVRHNNKIKMGHLKGNRFFIKVKKVDGVNAKKISQALKRIKKEGMPNFFGFQRFGTDGDNYKMAQEIMDGTRKEKNLTKKRMYFNAYQSHYFNMWLSRRLEVNRMVENFDVPTLCDLLDLSEDVVKTLKDQKTAFKLMQGDLMMHYPYGKVYEAENVADESERFFAKDIAPTGLLAGKRVSRAVDIAHLFEKEFDTVTPTDGARRYAWTFPQDVEGIYIEEEAQFEFHFTLAKGSYATVLLEEIAKQDLSIKK